MIPIFFHFEKSGGTSVWNALKQTDLYIEKFDQFHRKHFIDRIKPQLSGNPPDIIHGHMFYGLHTELEIAPFYLTVFREPVSRYISHYCHWRNRPGQPHNDFLTKNNHTLSSFLDTEISAHIDNLYVKRLANTFNPDENSLEIARKRLSAEFEYWTLEDIENCIERISKILDHQLHILHSNTGKKIEPDPETESRIRERNSLDLQLWSLL